jgi:hypothetical protein
LIHQGRAGVTTKLELLELLESLQDAQLLLELQRAEPAAL